MKKALLILAWSLAVSGSAMAQDWRAVSCDNGEKFTGGVIGTKETPDAEPASVIELAHMDKAGKIDKSFIGVAETDKNGHIYVIADPLQPQNKIAFKHISDNKFSMSWDNAAYENCSMAQGAGGEPSAK